MLAPAQTAFYKHCRGDCCFKVDELPTLGTGKSDLAKLNKMAREFFR